MTSLRAILVAVVGVLAVAPAVRAQVTEYDAVRSARPDGRVVPVEGLTLQRDAYRIELRSGNLHLLAPLGDETFGAVFLGSGTYTLQPATPSEQRHLQLVTGDRDLGSLTDRFDRLVLFFTDDTLAELQSHANTSTGAPDPQATRAYEDYLKTQQERLRVNLHLRVVADLLNRPDRDDGVFFAFVDGDDHSSGLMAIDPLGISNVAAQFGGLGGEEVAFISIDEQDSGFWYLSALTDEAMDGRGKPARQLADASHYEIDTTIDGGSFSGTTTITFTPLVEGVRVLPVNLFQRLAITSAALLAENGEVPLGLIQEDVEQGWFSRVFTGEASADTDAAVVFAKPLERGAAIRLRLEYEGRDVVRCSSGSCSVGARTSWYPNLGTFVDLATYETTFRHPRGDRLIGVGERVSERRNGDQTIEVWRSEVPLRVSGFNYGNFRERTETDDDTGLDIAVYTNPSSQGMARDALADAMNASRMATLFFGESPYARLSITQQVESNFGQSWPTLVYLPSIAFTSSTARAFAGGDPRAVRQLMDALNTVGWHEMAHQWWGHQVGWASYRDQWISEGLAEFTAALTLEAVEGAKGYDDFWEARREDIFTHTSPVANDQAGPITQGFRLGTRRSPGAPSAMIYSKGAYVAHMLRMLMRADGQPNPDAAFQAMMQDFVRSWAGRSPSTDDFQQVVERHMNVPPGGLDFFFDQWVRGMDVPRLRSTIEVTDLGGGRYRVSGAVSQEEVPDTFRTIVPIYLDFGDDLLVRLGRVNLIGTASQQVTQELELQRAPRRVVINARHDVLAR